MQQVTLRLQEYAYTQLIQEVTLTLLLPMQKNSQNSLQMLKDLK